MSNLTALAPPLGSEPALLLPEAVFPFLPFPEPHFPLAATSKLAHELPTILVVVNGLHPEILT